MKQLKNIRHTFDVSIGEIGVTIRKGDKWSKESIGTELELWNCPTVHYGDCTNKSCPEEGTGIEILCSYEGKGKIIGHWVGEFRKLPKSLLALEHNNQAKNLDILKRMMVTAYGSIEDTDIITALIYERIEKI